MPAETGLLEMYLGREKISDAEKTRAIEAHKIFFGSQLDFMARVLQINPDLLGKVTVVRKGHNKSFNLERTALGAACSEDLQRLGTCQTYLRIIMEEAKFRYAKDTHTGKLGLDILKAREKSIGWDQAYASSLKDGMRDTVRAIIDIHAGTQMQDPVILNAYGIGQIIGLAANVNSIGDPIFHLGEPQGGVLKMLADFRTKAGDQNMREKTVWDDIRPVAAAFRTTLHS